MLAGEGGTHTPVNHKCQKGCVSGKGDTWDRTRGFSDTTSPRCASSLAGVLCLGGSPGWGGPAFNTSWGEKLGPSPSPPPQWPGQARPDSRPTAPFFLWRKQQPQFWQELPALRPPRSEHRPCPASLPFPSLVPASGACGGSRNTLGSHCKREKQPRTVVKAS